ncbi:1,4-alpha-glucan branching protein GlgB [Alteromonas sp. 5E99-2]|uniref:1,4-alpha-glucan branching protein GlgB n=1 Tax=Alteromonas sp. 5E99-2 TaxID=2817683 RepID=UPI001A98AFCD|nr:1,4-alpha-glucan branching protein GlgB [Alteromonas sp. 5E99-2]MBO1256216.1 1,4-alpha-glucan branching protein GlgB [Alteromonas sp. 5E99-2]
MLINQQLEQARCTNPFSILGRYLVDDVVWIRAYLPSAISVKVVSENDELCKGVELARVTKSGLFEGPVDALSEASLYKLKVTEEGREYDFFDPYQFTEQAYHGVHFIDHAAENLYRQGGAQQITLCETYGIQATRFVVYAPNASSVSVIGDFNQWDGRCHPMQKTELGFWIIVLPQVAPGARYKYELKNPQGEVLPHKADPLGFCAEQYPSHASIVFDHSRYQWDDEHWLTQRKQTNPYQSPMSIYEVHLGSWMKPKNSSDKFLSYRDIAHKLVSYVKDMQFTHVELMPVSEYPFDGSWGYQPVGMFAPTSRFGSPDDFKYFVDYCHQNNVGVIIDWVPAHFPEDPHGLARFDGRCVYEYEDARKGWHPDWNSCIYDFGKDTVRQFLVASALMWCEHYHIDGLRVDAVASMLYLDYSREEGEWVPNVDGGNHNYEAISLLQWMNAEVYRQYPGAITIAEESTSFPKVSSPVFSGGLGFGFKWNMGWMNDSLGYIQKEPAHRKYHHGEITFSMVYAYDENFILPISHDEVVHGKGSLLNKMPGDEWQQAANLRAYTGFMFGHPGKKLNFMGNELGQGKEWDHDGELDWGLLAYPKHKGIQSLYRDLNTLYVRYPALYQWDHEAGGFHWVDHDNAEQSILSFARHDRLGKQSLYVIVNFTPLPRTDFKFGVKDAGSYRCILNTDGKDYWGSGFPFKQEALSLNEPMHGQPHAINIDIPPLSAQYWLIERE